MIVRRLGADDRAAVAAASHLFDVAPIPAHTDDFLARSGHHLLIAYDDERAVGFITGVEIAHPDKAAEMLVYELGVAEEHRRRGIATGLLAALGRLAADLGHRGLWVVTEPDNEAAIATYRSLGARRDGALVFEWGVDPT